MLYKTIYYLVLEILSDRFDKNVQKVRLSTILYGPYSIPCDTIWLLIIATEFTLVQPKLRLSTFLIRYHVEESLKYRLQIKFEWEYGVIPRVPISYGPYSNENMECITPKLHPKLNRLKCPLLTRKQVQL